MPELVLASTSRHRRALLERLLCDFKVAAPNVDETAHPGETPRALAARLAVAKARAVASRPALFSTALPTTPTAAASAAKAATPASAPATRRHLVIGSDQVADLDGIALGKPGDRATCIAQLMACSGRTVCFHTGLAVVDTRTGRTESIVEPFSVRFRKMPESRIAAYVDREQPLDAAGGFYAEGLGICLFEALEGRDPSALVGLPLIALVDMLADFGFDPLAAGAGEPQPAGAA